MEENSPRFFSFCFLLKIRLPESIADQKEISGHWSVNISMGTYILQLLFGSAAFNENLFWYESFVYVDSLCQDTNIEHLYALVSVECPVIEATSPLTQASVIPRKDKSRIMYSN